MENAVVYARYSSHSQTEQSIEGQLSAAKKYAEDHNYNIVHEYIDRAKSGTNDNRAEFQKMLKDTAKHKFTVIIVWKVDRFGRNREEITFNKYKCKKNNVRVEYIAENIIKGPEGVILESVLEGMAEYYSLQLSQNVSRGYEESAKKRHLIGTPVLGYEKDEDSRYKIVPHEADIVRLIFNSYIDGMSQFEIIKYLNSHGFKNKQGKPFTKNSIARILSDDKYIGNYRFKGELLEENCIPAIISKDQFNKAERAAKQHLKMNTANWNYSEYKLSDKLICGKCSSKMKGSSGYGKAGNKYLYYICPSCKKIHKRADVLDELVINKIYDVLNEGTIEEIADKVYDYYLASDNTSKEIERIEALLLDNEKRTSNILSSIEKGLDFKLCEGRLNDLKIEREELQTLKYNTEFKAPIKITKDMVKFFLYRIRDDKKESAILNAFIENITVYDEYCIIALNCVENSTKFYECSTDEPPNPLSDNQSNIRVYRTWCLVKMFF